MVAIFNLFVPLFTIVVVVIWAVVLTVVSFRGLDKDRAQESREQHIAQLEEECEIYDYSVDGHQAYIANLDKKLGIVPVAEIPDAEIPDDQLISEYDISDQYVLALELQKSRLDVLERRYPVIIESVFGPCGC